MNILFVCHRLPYPPNRGGKIRPFHMIQHLSRKHSVYLASLAESRDELEAGIELEKYCTKVLAEIVPSPLRWFRAYRSLLNSTPSSVAFFWSPALKRKIDQLSQVVSFDLVFVHCAFVAPYVLNVQSPRKVLDFGDIDSGKWFDYSKWRAFPLNLGYGLEYRKLRKFETEIGQQFDHCLVTTSGELNEYEKLAIPRPCTVVPNGVDMKYFDFGKWPRADRSRESPTIVFLGRMDYFPNVDAVCYFAKEILPYIRQQYPEVIFNIVGGDPTAQVRRLSHEPGVMVTGTVPDVRPFLYGADVMVAPLRIARGTQNKILESMAIGLPVVATPQAAKGIQAMPNQHLFVEDVPKIFAKRVLELFEDPTLQERFSLAARGQLEQAHSWPNAMMSMEKQIFEW